MHKYVPLPPTTLFSYFNFGFIFDFNRSVFGDYDSSVHFVGAYYILERRRSRSSVYAIVRRIRYDFGIKRRRRFYSYYPLQTTQRLRSYGTQRGGSKYFPSPPWRAPGGRRKPPSYLLRRKVFSVRIKSYEGTLYINRRRRTWSCVLFLLADGSWIIHR